MTILITGAHGWIGSHVMRRLGGRDVVTLDMRAADWVEQAASRDWEGCIHLAWPGISPRDHSAETASLGFDMSVRLIDALRCDRIVVGGSCFELGQASGCVREDAPVCAPNPVGMAKLATLNYLRGEVLPYRWARIFYAVGEGGEGHPESLGPSAWKAYAEGRDPEVRTPGATCDFVPVEQVAEALVRLLDADCPSGIFNVGSGTPMTASAYVDSIAQTFGKRFPISEPNGNGCWANMDKIEAALGWKPGA